MGQASASKNSRMISQITDTLGSYMTAPTSQRPNHQNTSIPQSARPMKSYA